MSVAELKEFPAEALYITLAYLLLFAQGFNSSL